MKTIDHETARRFGSRLTALRDASLRRRALGSQDRSRAAMVRSEAIVGSFRFLERVEALIADFVDDLGSVLSPDLTLVHRFFDGRYELAARLEELVRDEDGRPKRAFSRLVFLLEPDSETGRLTAECRITVRNRDDESRVWTVDMTDDGLTGLRAFLEQRCLAFAQGWCADEARPVA